MTVSADIGSFSTALARQPLRAFQIILVALLLLVLVIDGIDIQLLSLVAPVIIAEWGVQRADFGPALAGALIGMSAGSVVGGALGDRFGRLPLLVGSTILFGAATVIAGLTSGIGEMTALRIVSGIGFGAAAPNAIALATDWLPDRARAQVTSLLSIGTPAGGMIGASLVIALLPHWGWRGTFYASGMMTVGIALAILLYVRESPSFLAAHGRVVRAQKVARRCIGLDWNPAETTVRAKLDIKTRSAVSFLARENLRLNLGAGLGFSVIAFVSYALVAWTAIMLTGLGFAMDQAITAVFAFNLAAVSAAVIAGFVMARVGTRAMLAGASFLLCACLLILSVVLDGGDAGSATRMVTYLLVGGAGGLAGAAMASIYAMMATGYGVECRSGGLGFGMMLGRAGGILASLAGGYLLELRDIATWPFLATLAVLAALGGVCAFVSDRHVVPRKRAGAASALTS